ncbi:helix-turn-helix transcriptional regulator [Amycolatopsis sp.]|uniref:helix-turn-helix transcriptional regulator n=1 Tax=Amycolatopsis sp. TaxID=37632 RepID=UPI002E02F857|nr:helix-turn-helix transcriptional regulator [Amycolatopsis sp.]
MSQKRTFAEKLSALIEGSRANEEAPHSYREMSSAIDRAAGPAMSPAYIQQLATGKRINPKIHYVEALARLFGVPVSHFFDDTSFDDTSFDEEEPAEAQAGEAKLMAMRAQELSPKGRRQVMDLLDLVERYERAERRRSGE